MDVIELVEALKTADGETAMELIERLQCGQVDCSAINVSHWAVDNPGLADQMRAESREVRRALAFDPEGEDIAPCDLVEAIEGLRSALSANGGEVEVNSCDGCAAGMPLHHVDPATHRTHMLCTANRYAPPSVAVPDDVTAAPPPDHSGDSNEVGAAPASFVSARELADWLDSFYETLEDGSFTGSKWDVAQAAAKAVRGHGHIADAGKVAFVDGLGAQRMTAEECKEGIEYIIHGDNIYWPLSDDDELRLIQAACGNGEFTYPQATPSVPENEIKALALEEYADQLDVVFANAQEAGASDCPAWHAGQFAKDARKQAARLRTAGDEGEG